MIKLKLYNIIIFFIYLYMLSNVYKYLAIELKIYILTFLDKKCFKCDKIIYFSKNELYYNYYPFEYNNDFTKFTLCLDCLSNLHTINTNHGLLSYC